MDSPPPFGLCGGRWIVRWAPPGFPDVSAGIIGRTAGAGGAPGGADEVPTARLDQVHGAAVVRAEGAGVTPVCDASITTRSGLRLRVNVADCVPVFLVSAGGLGLAHAGWRGTAAGIVGKAVDALATATGDSPRNMKAWIGPCIGPCCYEVGRDVADRFPVSSLVRGGGHLDLRAANRAQLFAAGLPAAGVDQSPLCTKCHQHILHSHRGSGGGPGRMNAVLMRRDPLSHFDRVFS